MDNLTREQRRRNMQNIRSTDTKVELLIARELRKRKIYCARNVRSIIGKPDFVFRRRKVVVFVDSDFWHGHPKRCIMPKSNCEYWEAKIQRNKRRDKEVVQMLNQLDWKVVRIWERDVQKSFDRVITRIIEVLEKAGGRYDRISG